MASFFVSDQAFSQAQLVKEYNLDFTDYPDFEHYSQSIDFAFGGYAIAGGIQDPTPGFDFDPSLVTIDEDGNLAGVAKYYDIPNSKELNVHVTTISANTKSESGYLISGNSTNSPNSTPYEGFLIKTNTQGDVQWARTLKDYDNGYLGFQFAAVEQVSNGDVIMVGHNGLQDDNRAMIVIRINPLNGAVKWYEKYRYGSEIDPTGFIEVGNGEYYIFGGSRNKDFSFAFKLTDDLFDPIEGNFKVIYFNGQISSHDGMITCAVQDGNQIVFGGHFENGNPNGFMADAIVLFRMDLQLNSIQSMSGVPNQVSAYTEGYDAQIMGATDLLKVNDRFVLHGYIYPDLANQPQGLTIVTGLNGSISNSKIGNGLLHYGTYSETSFLHNNEIVRGNNMFSGKYRFTKSTLMGNSCDDDNFEFGTYSHAVTSYDRVLEELPVDYMYRPFEVVAKDLEVDVADICENCPDPIVENDPITTNTGGTAFCTGSSLTLTAPSGYSSYVWLLNGSAVGTGPSTTANQPGVYTVVCITEEGCEVEVSINIHEIEGCEVMYAFPEISYCSLNNPPPYIGWYSNPLGDCSSFYSFVWTHNGNWVSSGGAYNIPWQGPGLYEVTVNTFCGSQTFSQNIVDQLTVYANSPIAYPTDIGYINGNDIQFQRLNQFPGYAYTEFIITDGTNTYTSGSSNPAHIGVFPNYDYGINGTLTITCNVYDYTKCNLYTNTTTWSDPTKSANGGGGKSIEVNTYPNPAKNELNIEILDYDSDENYKLTVYDMTGNLIITQTLLYANNRINISNLEDGTYMISIHSSTGIHQSKFTKL